MYGFIVPNVGLALLAQAAAGQPLIITRVMVGKGQLSGDPATITNLVDPVAVATSSVPVVDQNKIQFLVEYRNDMNGGLAQGFQISEFGVFGKIGTGTEALLYYGSLGDHPQWINPISAGLDVRRYPVSIAVTNTVQVTLAYPAGSFATSQELTDAIDTLSDVIQEVVDTHVNNKNNPHNVTAAQVGADPSGTANSVISSHNTNETPHANMGWAKLVEVYTRIQSLSPKTKTLFNLLSTAIPDDALRLALPWRLLRSYTTAGSYIFTSNEIPEGINEIGVFIIGAGGGGRANGACKLDGPTTSWNTNLVSGGSSGQTVVRIDKAPFKSSYNIVVGAGGKGQIYKINSNDTTGSRSPENGSSSSFDSTVAEYGGQAPHAQVLAKLAAMGEANASTASYPAQCINPFDGRKRLLAGGNASAYAYMNTSDYSVTTTLNQENNKTDEYGQVGSSGLAKADVTSVTATAQKGTSYGCGGGAVAAVMTYNSSGLRNFNLQAADGVDGAVLIYGRGWKD